MLFSAWKALTTSNFLTTITPVFHLLWLCTCTRFLSHTPIQFHQHPSTSLQSAAAFSSQQLVSEHADPGTGSEAKMDDGPLLRSSMQEVKSLCVTLIDLRLACYNLWKLWLTYQSNGLSLSLCSLLIPPPPHPPTLISLPSNSLFFSLSLSSYTSIQFFPAIQFNFLY